MEILEGMQKGLRRVLNVRGARSREQTFHGHRVHYYFVPGYRPERPPVVLVHGLGGAANGFYKLFFPLAEQFGGVYALDLPGNGFSTPLPGEPLSMQEQFEVLKAFCQQVVPQPAFVVGNSLGGAMSLKLADEAPDRVRALALVAPAGAPLEEAQLTRLMESLQVTTHAETRALTRKLFVKAPWSVLLLASELQKVYSTPSVRRICRETKATDFIEPALLAGLKMPTLLLWGSDDKLLPAQSVNYFRAHLPAGAEVHVVKGFGHVPQMEHPRELLAHLVDFAARRGL